MFSWRLVKTVIWVKKKLCMPYNIHIGVCSWGAAAAAGPTRVRVAQTLLRRRVFARLDATSMARRGAGAPVPQRCGVAGRPWQSGCQAWGRAACAQPCARLQARARGVGDSRREPTRGFGAAAGTAERFGQRDRSLPALLARAAAQRAAGEVSFPGNTSCRRSHLFLGLRPGLPGEITTPAGFHRHRETPSRANAQHLEEVRSEGDGPPWTSFASWLGTGARAGACWRGMVGVLGGWRGCPGAGGWPGGSCCRLTAQALLWPVRPRLVALLPLLGCPSRG